MASFDVGVVWRALPYVLLDGLSFTLTLTLLSALGGIVLGIVVALMRISGSRVLSALAAGYVNLIRSLPLVLVIFWFYFLVPYIAQWITRSPSPVQVGAFSSALITFTAFEAAYFAEIVRSGINSVGPGQMGAGLAIGLRRWQVLAYVILPQALRAVLPVMLTQTIILFQDTSLVYVLGLTDLLGAASKIAQRDGRLVEMYLTAAVIYFAISLGASYLVRRLRFAGASAAH
ncbi:amino acid ABC transporter permease [uncultured Enterovirga sp.]|uniref:amino acid ABC transporter permease n=1 Tax=uncultured Enterovirga sp. TaxID=2026352 RepID=UPI0035CB9324